MDIVNNSKETNICRRGFLFTYIKSNNNLVCHVSIGEAIQKL